MQAQTTAPGGSGKTRGPKPIPKAILWAIGGIMVLTLALTFASSLTGIKADLHQPANLIEDRQVYFDGLTDGAMTITDFKTGETLWVIEPGTNTFARTVLRGFSQRRVAAGVNVPASFTLARADNGHVYMFDWETDHYVMLDAFGQDNKAVLARLIDTKGASQ